jgi:hypothetical protein
MADPREGKIVMTWRYPKTFSLRRKCWKTFKNTLKVILEALMEYQKKFK